MSNSKYFKTKFDVPQNTAVYSTKKTLNERFTINTPRSVFVLRNGFTAPYKNIKVTGKIAFENGRDVNCNRRFSLYQHNDINLIEKDVLSPEDKNRLITDLEDIRRKRRKVLAPKKSNDETSAKCCEEFNISTQNNGSSTACSSRSNSNEELKTGECEGKDDKIKNTTSHGRLPIKRTWDMRVKNVYPSSDKISKDIERDRFISPSELKTREYGGRDDKIKNTASCWEVPVKRSRYGRVKNVDPSTDKILKHTEHGRFISPSELKTGGEYGGKEDKIKNITSCGKVAIKRSWYDRVKNVDPISDKISKDTELDRCISPSKEKTGECAGNDDNIKNASTCDKVPIKHSQYVRVKNVDPISDDKISKDTERDRFLIPSPYQAKIGVVYRNRNFFSSVYKWQKVYTKEELDEELDRYMGETKIQVTATTPVMEDLDSFVWEYMSETEKLINESKMADINID